MNKIRLLPVVVMAVAALLVLKTMGLVTNGGYLLAGETPSRAQEHGGGGGDHGGGGAAVEGDGTATPADAPTLEDSSPTLDDAAPTLGDALLGAARGNDDSPPRVLVIRAIVPAAYQLMAAPAAPAMAEPAPIPASPKSKDPGLRLD